VAGAGADALSAEPPYIDDADEDEGGTEGDEGEDQAFDAAAPSAETTPVESSVESNEAQATPLSHESAVDEVPAYRPTAEAPIESHVESAPAEAPDQPLPPERFGD
jgi:hypothetical protein